MTQGDSRPAHLAAARAVGAVWWYFLIRGLLLLGAGIFLLAKPELTAAAFAKLIGFLVLVDGALAIVAGLMGRAESRFWSLLRGCLMLALGLFIFLQPALVASVAIKTLLFIIGPLILIGGILEIISARRGRRATGRGGILSGVLIAIFGLLLILAPMFFGKLILQIIGVVAILSSLLLLFLAFKFRKVSKRIADAPPVIDT